MNTPYVLSLSDPQATLALAGGKGASLARLAAAGLPVPAGFHVTTTAYQQFVTENDLQSRIQAALQTADPSQPATLETASTQIRTLFAQAAASPAITDAIRSAYLSLPTSYSLLPTPSLPVAVRSSATAEDLPDLSFAGQQETYLNVQGIESVLDAVQRCWASLWTARAIGYRMQHGIDQETVSLAVAVQQLVPAEAAGVMFTANPFTGRRDQVMISAAWGLGESVVGGTVTPDMLTLDKATGQVTTRDTADKQVMTERVAGGTAEQPTPENLRRAPVLDDAQAAELARLGVQIENLYGMPMDIEWAFTLPSPSGRGAGGEGRFFILQARPITALPPEPPAPSFQPPTEWTLPNPKAIGFRSSIIEQLPDPLTPLFGTLGRRVINAGTAYLFNDILRWGIPDEIYVTVNDYAYFQMHITFKFLWRMLGFLRPSVWRILLHTESRWRDEAHPHYVAVIERWKSRPPRELPAADLLTATRELLAEAVNTYTILQSGIIGVAMGAEMGFAAFYDKLIKRRTDPPALTFLLGLDSLPILAEKSLYDVAQVCRERPVLADYVAHTPTAQLVAQLTEEGIPSGLAENDWGEWQHRFREHLVQYGHTTYDLDFAKPTPADDPAPLLETVKMYLKDQGTSPYQRQQALSARRDEAVQTVSGRLRGLRLKWFRKLLGWAHRYGPMREDSLADLGLGYPLLRQMLGELGRRLVEAGMLAQADDVYWLYEPEAVQAAAALDRGETLNPMTEAILQRKAVWQAKKQAMPPVGLPQDSRWMKRIAKIGPARTGGETGAVIKGAGASPGRAVGTARVLRGPEDFDQMQPGDILVAAITTPAWTPLFAMAAAIVTDVGGPFSHGSIVAREYGIPAVLGTGAATRRIRSGQTITVDGTAGEVILT